MIFTDSTHKVQIELIDRNNCKLTMISDDAKQLEGINRLLAWCIRKAPLDGGDRLNFTHELTSDKNCILIQGDLLDAVNTLESIDRFTKELRDDFIEQIMLIAMQNALNSMSTLARQQVFSHKLKENLPSSPHSSATSSPKLFV